MTTFARAFILSLGLTTLAVAQSTIDGNWSGTVQDDAGEHRVMLTLKVVDDVISGSIIEPEGAEYSIYEGAVVNNQLQFNTARRDGETRVVTQWVGTVNGNEIAFTRATENSAAESFTVRRN